MKAFGTETTSKEGRGGGGGGDNSFSESNSQATTKSKSILRRVLELPCLHIPLESQLLLDAVHLLLDPFDLLQSRLVMRAKSRRAASAQESSCHNN